MTQNTLKRNGNIINKKYLEYFLPTVLTAMANNIAIMVDSVLVGQMVGSVAMAAINLLSPVTQLYFSITILFGLGASTIISYSKGKNDKETADKTLTAALILLVILCVILMSAQFLFIDNIASVLTSIPELKEQLLLYYVPFIIGTPFSLLLPSAVHCIRSDGRPTFASNLIIISNAINLVMDIVLMGPFKMGIMGSSIATVIGNVIAFAIMLTHFKYKNNTLHFDFTIFRNPKEFLLKFAQVFTTGLSGALGTLLITVRMFYLNSIIQSHAGTNGMVAMSIVTMSQIFISAFVTGASQTMIPIVSVLLGEKDFSGIKYALKKAILILMIASSIIVIIIECAPQAVAYIFGVETTSEMQVVVPALMISSLSFHGLALSFLIMYYYMATNKKIISLTISIVNGIVIIIPSAYFLGILFGITGIWIAFVAAQYGTLIVIAIMVLVIIKKSKGRYKNFYLLEDSYNNEIMSFSVNSQFSEDIVEKYMTENLSVSDNETKLLIILAVKNILSYIISAGSRKNKPVDVDLRIINEDNKYFIFIRSNGNELDGDNLMTRVSTYKGFDFTRVLGMNEIKIII